MVSLADAIYEGSKAEESSNVDEFGLTIFDNPDYLVARAIAAGKKQAEFNPFTIDQPHMRGDSIYIGNQEIQETVTNLYMLCHTTKEIKRNEVRYMWALLKKHLPRLDLNIIQISDNLFWNVASGEIIQRREMKHESNSRDQSEESIQEDVEKDSE